MAETRKLPRAKKDDVLTAQMWNDLVDRVNRTRVLFGEGNGFDVMETPDGVMVRATNGPRRGGLGKANGDITARAGTTAGTGTVDVWDYSTGVLAATGESISVLNVGILIASGKYVWYEEDEAGGIYAAPLECS